MRRAILGVILIGLLVGGLVLMRGPFWIKQGGRNPVAAIGNGAGASLSITCMPGRDPVYVLDIRGPARGLKPGRGVQAVIEGRERASFRLDRVTLDAGGQARMVGRVRSRGEGGDSSGMLQAIESVRMAKGPIGISSGSFRFTVSSRGVRSAMAPLVRKCGERGR